MSAFEKVRMLPGAVDAAAVDEAILDLRAIGAGVHAQRAADRARNAAQEAEGRRRRPWRRRAPAFMSRAAAPASTFSPSMAISSNARPSRITTPGKPPSRTRRLEPAPTTQISCARRQPPQEIGEVGFVRRLEQDLRRAAGAKPCQRGERRVGGESVPRRSGISSRRAGVMSGKA